MSLNGRSDASPSAVGCNIALVISLVGVGLLKILMLVHSSLPISFDDHSLSLCLSLSLSVSLCLSLSLSVSLCLSLSLSVSLSLRSAVAAILSDFFHHEGFLDVVPSDVVAGILLVRFQQRIAAIKVSHSFPIRPPLTSLPPSPLETTTHHRHLEQCL
jgi:hypothetical protein